MHVTVCKCDICGKDIVTNNPDGHVEIELWDNNRIHSDNYDLCDECVNKVLPKIYDIINLAKKGITILI